MHRKELIKLGIPHAAHREAEQAARAAAGAGMKKKALRRCLLRVVADPAVHVEDALFGPLAQAMLDAIRSGQELVNRDPAPYAIIGQDIDRGALAQMQTAATLPVAIRGALLPDAHIGYGLPIGGVLAVRNAVIPYGVGMDIACRVKLSMLDMDPGLLDSKKGRAHLATALDTECRFGVGACFNKKTGFREHPVMDEDWAFSPVVNRQKQKAHAQLGTSGCGNHFVEFGILRLQFPILGLEPGSYPALVSHGGSRGPGGEIARHFSSLARRLQPHLPRGLQHLAWLSLKGHEGQEYWKAMELMGRYASANHQLIHHHILRHLGIRSLASVENHHNFAWIEEHDGQEMVVHRKGATPAGKDMLGYIPGSMADPGFLVQGRGNPLSLASASHGAGRAMSRKEASSRFNRKDLELLLQERGVTLVSGTPDESPLAYKDIRQVMQAQHELLAILGRFIPRLVKMAP